MKVYELLETTQLDEGPWDYAKGLGRHVGGKIASNLAARGEQIMAPIRQAHQAGQQASQQGNIRSLTQNKQQLIQQLVRLTSATQIPPQEIIKMIFREMGTRVDIANTLKRDFSAAYTASQQAPTNEGLFDYLRGAGGAAGGAARRAGQGINRAAGTARQAVGGAARQIGHAAVGAAGQVGRSAKQAGQVVGGAVRDIHQQGQQASIAAEQQRKQQQIQQTIQRIGQIMLKLSNLQRGA